MDRDRRQATAYEHETSNEGLRASNDEFQSRNEELVTVNEELKTKIEELGDAYSDLQNLMAATQIATLFLDRDLHIKRFTPRTTDLFDIFPADLGRPFEHLSHALDSDRLPDLAQHVLESQEMVEEELGDKDGRWFMLRMLPYRTLDDRIEGVVITLVEITQQKTAEVTAATRAEQQASVADLGMLAIETTDLDPLFDTACRNVAAVLGNAYCKVLELEPDGKRLLLRNGVGWHDGLVGTATVPNDARSQAGYTLLASEPVIVENVADETRFTAPNILRDHDVVSGMSVLIPGPSGPWGVLGTHDPHPRTFSIDDAHFLQTVANVLGEAIARLQTDAALRARTAILEAVIESMPDAVYVGDGTGIMRCNEQALRLIGAASLEDLQGHSAELGRTFNVRHSETGEPLDPEEYPFFQALQGHAATQDILAANHATGSDLYLRAAAAPIHLDGEVIGAVGINIDISERHRTQQALREAEARAQEQISALEALYQASPVGLALQDTDLRYLRINDRLAAINGLPAEDHLGKTPRELFADLADTIEPLQRQVLETGEPLLNLEVKTVTLAHRETRRYLVSYLPQRNTEGVVSGISVVVQDLSELFQTEAALQEARERLADEQARLLAVLEQLPVGVILADRSTEAPTLVNDAARALLRDLPHWDEYGDAFERWLPYYPTGELYAPEDQPMLRALRKGEAILGEEIRYPHADGSWQVLLVNAAPVYNANGTIVAGVAAFQDVTRLRDTQEALAALNTTLEERVTDRTEQVRALTMALTLAEQHERARIAQVLHDDLQQLLYGLRLKIQTLHKEVREADKEQNGLEPEETAYHLKRAEALLDQALRTTRTLTLDLKPPVFEGEGLDATLAWLARHMTDLHALAVTLHHEGPPLYPSPPLHILIFQLVRELLFNVIKHAGVNAADIYVRSPNDGRFSVIVEDHGVGFDPEQVTSGIFGLFSLRERIGLFGGELDIWSHPNAGTRVTLTLPIDNMETS